MEQNILKTTGTKGGRYIRALKGEDVRDIVSIHLAAFPDSALTLLGPEAVRRYYVWQMSGPHDCVAVGVFQDERLSGFCFAGTFHGALSGFLKDNRLFLLGRFLLRPYLLLSPRIRDRVLQTVRMLRPLTAPSQPKNDEHCPSPRSFGILSIAVDPSRQGDGLGQSLIEVAESEARDRGFERMHLTVSPKNLGAVRFYERQHWQKVQDGDGWKGYMQKNLEVL